jgi:hypothetical protein
VKELIDSGPTVIVFLLDSLSEESLALVAMPTIRYLVIKTRAKILSKNREEKSTPKQS